MLQPTAAHRAPQFWRRRIRCRRARAAGVHESTPSTQPLGPPLSTGERAEHVQRRHVLRHDGSQYVTERRDVMACRRCPRGPRCDRRNLGERRARSTASTTISRICGLASRISAIKRSRSAGVHMPGRRLDRLRRSAVPRGTRRRSEGTGLLINMQRRQLRLCS